MTDLASNPIYKRIIEGSKGPSVWVCMLFGVIVAIAASGWHFTFISEDYLGSGYVVLYRSFYSYYAIPTMLMLPLPLFTFAAMILTARRTARLVSNEDFALVRISGIAEADIVRGYTEGARYRARLWIATSMGALAAFCIGQVITWLLREISQSYHSSGRGLLGTQELVEPTNRIIASPLLYVGAVIVILFLSIDYWVAWPLALTGAVWAALCSPRNATLITAGQVAIMIVYTLFAVAVVWEVRIGPYSILARKIDYVGTFTLLVLVIPYAVLRLVRADCVRLVSKREL